MNKLQLLGLGIATSLCLPSCMTTYDRSGRPVQSVDPGLAAVGIIGAGLIGAAIASDSNNHGRQKAHRRHHNGYYHEPRPCATRHGHYRHHY